MRNRLWYTIWDERRRLNAINKSETGFSFLGSYIFKDFKTVFIDICSGLNLTQGSPTSHYGIIIPKSKEEVVRIRLSDHRSTEEEWKDKEVSGIPNKRYSIVIFSNKSMPIESEQQIRETKWRSYLSNGIPVYEKCFNRFYLNETMPKLIQILSAIYTGQSPEDNTISINLNENKVYKTNRKMKQTIRLNETDLHRMIKESVRQVLNENDYTQDEKDYLMGFKKAEELPYSSSIRQNKEINDFIKRLTTDLSVQLQNGIRNIVNMSLGR